MESASVRVKRWARHHDRCRRCKTTKKRHSAQGYCGSCYRRTEREGKLKMQDRRYSRLRRRDGIVQKECLTCDHFLPLECFPFRKHGGKMVHLSRCWECERRIRREEWKNDPRRRARHRERERMFSETSGLREPKRPSPMFPSSLIATWFEEAYESGDYEDWREVAHACNMADRQLYSIRNGEWGEVTLKVAERVALGLGFEDKLAEALGPTGKPGWSKYGDHCLRCGATVRPHYAKGFCARCYAVQKWHKSQGQEPPPPREERWTNRHAFCRVCKRMDIPHASRGICARCMGRYQTAAKKLGLGTAAYLDRLGIPVDYPKYQAMVKKLNARQALARER